MNTIKNLIFFINIKLLNLQKLFKNISYIRSLTSGVIIITLSYILASNFNVFLFSIFVGSIDTKRVFVYNNNYYASSLNLNKNINYVDIKNIVMQRNIFNSEGAFPQESEVLKQGDSVSSKTFDINAPCSPCSLPLNLIGTIYLSKGKSIAVIREEGVSQADVYKEGDKLISDENVTIVKIEQNKVILNNNGIKECLEIIPPKVISETFSPQVNISSVSITETPQSEDIEESNTIMPSNCNNIVLDHNYVTEQLGEGFANILNKGRLIPYNQNGIMKGFKLIGVDPNSLFGKICLRNGDVITEVNDISLQQPEQGFSFYQAFQDEKKIRINGLRGEKPFSIYVEIQ